MPWENLILETSLPIRDEQGYLIIAVNDDHVDYVRCAQQLAHSLRAWHPDCKICLATDNPTPLEEFDYVEGLPHGNQQGFANDWQAWSVSPFRETIKLEADMLVCSAIDHWWTLFRNRDVVISRGARDFYDNQADSRFYRKLFDTNDLPDVYNAVTYWRMCPTAMEFWHLVKSIFQRWSEFRQLLKFPDDEASTDVVYAMAARIMGEELVTLPCNLAPQIVHMKQHMIPILGQDWTQELVWEYRDRELRINTVSQWGLVHYQRKDWTPHEQ